MKSKYSRLLNEKFGEPIGAIPGITSVGVVGVRDDSIEETCPNCQMLPTNSGCDCDHSSGEDDGMVCTGCGMMVVNGSCGCRH